MTTRGLVGAWCPSLGATGFRLLDRSGRGNHGTLTNMASTAWTTSGGKVALSFDGVNDFVNLGNPRVVSSGLPLFVSAWFRTSSSLDQVIVAKSVFGGATHRWWLSTGSRPGTVSANGSNSEGGGSSADFATTYSDGKWHQIAALYSGSTMSLFFNGQFRASAAILQLEPTNRMLLVGKYNDGSGGATGDNFPFGGQIDDFRIYNRSLTAPEIRQMYIGGRGFGLLPEPPKRRARLASAAGFRAYWARQQSKIIGGGL